MACFGCWGCDDSNELDFMNIRKKFLHRGIVDLTEDSVVSKCSQ